MLLIGAKSFKWDKIKSIFSYNKLGILPSVKHMMRWQKGRVLGMNVKDAKYHKKTVSSLITKIEEE